MQNLKNTTKIILIVLSIVAVSSAVGVFIKFKTDMVEDTLKTNILHESVEKATNQGHFILTPATEVFDKESEPEAHPAKEQELEHKEAPNYLARP